MVTIDVERTAAAIRANNVHSTDSLTGLEKVSAVSVLDYKKGKIESISYLKDSSK